MLKNNSIVVSYIQRFCDVLTPISFGYFLYFLQFEDNIVTIPYFILFAVSAMLVNELYEYSQLNKI